MNSQNSVKGFPLSRQQQTLYKQQVNWPQRVLSVCNITLTQAITPERLSAWLTELVVRHEALRIEYVQSNADALPIQVIADPYAVNVATHASADELTSSPYFDSAATSYFDSECDSLQARLSVNNAENAVNVLQLALPAMSVDAVSWQVLAHEIAQQAAGEALSDIDDIVQYVDFADWQDEVVAEDSDAQQFWEVRTANQQAVLPRLPGEGALCTPSISSSTQDVIAQTATFKLAENVQGTHVRSAFAWLLSQWLGHEKIHYNWVADGRLGEDFAEGIGAFERQLPIQVNVEPNTTVSALLNTITEDDDLLLANQMSTPLQGAFARYSYRETHRTVVQNPAVDTNNAAIAQLSSVIVQSRHISVGVEFDSSLQQLSLQYDTKCWDSQWINTMAQLLAATANSLASARGEQLMQNVVLLENAQVLPFYQALNSSVLPASKASNSTSCLLHRLGDFAQQTPDAIAVSDNQQQLTYAQLLQRAMLRANDWRNAGLKEGQRVAIHSARHVALVESLLAVWICGAHYVAVDPSLPEARQHWLVQASDYYLTFEDGAFSEISVTALPATLSEQRVALANTNNAQLKAQLEETLATHQSLSALAYVLYTSGSTGEPKGVQISQDALSHYLDFAANAYCQDIQLSLVHTSIGFDLTVTSLFAPLWAGKHVHMVTDNGIGVDDLCAALANSRHIVSHANATERSVTPESAFPQLLLKLTPAHLKALAPWLQTEAADKVQLTRLVVGGEALAAADVAPYFERFPSLSIINEYGPTEATVGCSVHQVSALDKGNIGIGKPIAGMGFYVLDAQQQLTMPGMTGELYISGPGLAEGYANLDDMTTERFVTLASVPEQRLYKTGDLVRLVATTEGFYEFLGRNDRQVKVRGYRIELEEIEASIKQHIACRDAVVLSRQNQHQVTELVAYLQANDAKQTHELSADQLSQQLHAHLPEYMLPTQWVVLAEFPLTVNGKVDIQQLPNMANQQQQAYVAPTNELEKQLVEIWQTALNVERIGVQDNFFTLGGDSIRGVHVVALAKAANVNLSIQQVFMAKTIAALAELLADDSSAVADDSAVAPYQAFSMISETDREKLPEGVEDAYPLGTVQLGMLYHMHTTRDANTPPDYHNVASFMLRLDHTYQPELFQQAVDKVVETEPYLRASFELSQFSQPLQLIHQQAKLRVGYHDWRKNPHAATELDEFVAAENFRLIDTTCAPLMRLRVHHLQDGMISLSLTEPHSLADGWSTHLTLIDIFAVYLQLVDGKPVQITPVTTRYSQFVQAEQAAIQSPETKAFWKAEIDRAVSIELPPKAQQQDDETLGEHRHRLPISPEVLHGLTAVAKQAQVPIKSVLLAAHMRLLALLSGETTITTGLNFNGRLETDDGIKVRGLFLNMLPVTLTLSGGSWLELAQAAHQAEIAILPHRRYPLGLLLSEFGKDKLFDSALSFLHFHSLATESDDIEKRVISEGIIDHSKTNYDFNAVFDRDPFDPDALTYIGDANLDRFTRSQLDEFLSFYMVILQDIAEHPEADYRRLHYLSDEQVNTLQSWQQGTQVSALQQPEVAMPVVTQFEQLAASQPDSLAVINTDNRTYSYAQLNAEATKMAHALQANGVEAGDYVALHLPRSVQTVACVLAIHKLGAAYIPLETSYPQQRIQDVLEDSGARFIVSDQNDWVLPNFTQQLSIAQLLTTPTATTANHSTQAFPTVTGDHCAYVLYTSGSTGKPKGVMISQRALSDYITWSAQQYVQQATTNTEQETSNKRCPLRESPSLHFGLFSPLSFDLTVTSLFTPLVTGGAISVYHSEDAAGLIEQIVADNRVDVIKMTPAHLALLQVLPIETWKATRIIVGGEQLQGQLAQAVSERMPSVAIYNEYGPTETTVGCTVHQFIPQCDANDAVPIGLPANNTQAIVLDAFGLPAPIGVKGELFITGPGVATGYVARDTLNAECFVTLAQANNARAYRTGDVVRWRDDGRLVFVGRADDQVKIRGYRIELGEIEAVIAQCSGIAQVIVDVEGAGQDKQLIAYMVRQVNTEVDAASVRQHCSQQLPDYMLPARSVFVPHLPLTPNGKIDRKQLSFLLADGSTQTDIVQREYVAPRNGLEESLCQIWQEALHCERVGIEDNFFELGGHSIQALHLIPTIQEKLSVRLSLTAFLKNPTISSLSAQLATQTDADADEETLPKIGFDRENLAKPFPLTPVQQAYLMGRSSVFELGNVATHSYIEFEWESMDVARFQACFNRLVCRHDMLRAVFSEQGEQQILTDISEYPIHYQDYSTFSAAAREQALLEVRSELSHQVLAIDRWPLFDLRISRVSEQRCRVHFSMDALLADAMSFDIIDKEITEMYLNGPSVQLPEIHTSFRDYVLAEQALKHTKLFANAKQYWVARLDTLPEAPQLPLAKQPSEILHPTFERRHFRLQKDRWTALQKQASKHGVTPTVMVLTLFSAVLRQWCKNDSFTLNLTLFNRLPLHEHVNHILGDFTSLTLLQIDTQSNDTLQSAAKRIQQQLWNDLEHRVFGGMDVLRALNAHEGRIQAANMPIVFSSTLGLNEGDAKEEDPLDVDATFSITQTPQVWLDHQVTEEFGELVLSWDAIAALFPVGMLDDMFQTYTGLVTKVANGDAVTLNDLGLPESHSELIAKYNQTHLDVVQSAQQQAGVTEPLTQEHMFLHTPFLQQVAARPNDIALISAEQTLTYAQLHQRALALAEQLQQQQVTAGELVAVVMEKGWQQTVAVLGILYAGGAYLPVDAHQPRKRLEQVLALGESRVSIVQSSHADSLSWLADTQTVLTADDYTDARSNYDALTAHRDVSQLAYVIFTSGSTGTPKGVMIDHQGAINTCLDINQRYGITSQDRVLAISALNFDLSVYDIFGVLAAGGTIVVPDADKEKDPHHWANLVQSHQITVWNSVPAIAHLLIEEVQKHPAALAIPTLKLIMMSGDWIPLELAGDAREIRPDIRLISMGGATEASIWSIFYPINGIAPHWHSVPYGRPLANQGFHVFNAELQPCPLWVVGELYISGIGLAQGYWKDAERTASSFVYHPVTGERFYRTGDLGRMLPEGNIEFLGREDNQVKLHGHRVELGEVEAVIAMQPQVKNAAVIVHTSETNQKHLLAYVVPDESENEAADSVIDDAMEFKLAQHGLLTYSENYRRVTLPEVEHLSLAPKSKPLATAAANEANVTATQLTITQCGHWLSALRSVDMPGQAMGKRHYPSAGGLYPIRTWLILPTAQGELDAGCYYYDPILHVLVNASQSIPSNALSSPIVVPELIAKQQQQAHASIVFQAVPEAIQPIYGENTERFMALEIGHMQQLLQDVGATVGVQLHYSHSPQSHNAMHSKGVHLNQYRAESSSVDRTLAANDDPASSDSEMAAALSTTSLYTVLTIGAVTADATATDALGVEQPPLALTIYQRQSIRHFVQRDISISQLKQWLSRVVWENGGQELSVCLYLRPGMVSDGEGGYYRFDAQSRTLTHVCDDESARGYTLFGDNQVIERDASFSLYIIGDAHPQAWQQAGTIGQSLQQQAHQFGLGVCPVGKVHQARLKMAKLTDDEHTVIYALEGGIVEAHAYEHWPSVVDANDSIMQEIYKDELRVRLPYYMIPDFFVVMDELPLTANGKIDRKSLPIPEFSESNQQAFVPPADAIEQHLWQFCANNLQAEQISCSANLLELGADSLFAIRFVSEVRVAFGIEMNLRAFFEHANIQAMAAIIHQEGGQLSEANPEQTDTALDDEMEEGTL